MLFLQCKKKDSVIVTTDDDNKGKTGIVTDIIPKDGFRKTYPINKIEVTFPDKTVSYYYDWQLSDVESKKSNKP